MPKIWWSLGTSVSNVSPFCTCATPSLVFYHRCCDWLAVCSLACPWDSLEPGNWDVLKATLADGFLLPVYREQFLYLQVPRAPVLGWVV